jgi:acetylornithine deacetylase
MKGSLAAMLAAVKALNLANVKLDGDILLTAVADEEFASLGSDHLIQHYHADAAIVTEPTDLELALAHRGFASFEVETIGRAAHGSRYQDGIDAILLMGRFLAGLDALEQELRRPPHPSKHPPARLADPRWHR